MEIDVNICTTFLKEKMMETRQEATANNLIVLKAQNNKEQKI